MIRIPKIFKNIYFLTIVGAIVWITFFDTNNLIYQSSLSDKLQEAQNQKQFYLDEIRKDSTALSELMTNQNTLEKFAREKYLMKKDNEDIYLIVREKKE
jgi:cell division protein DivIC